MVRGARYAYLGLSWLFVAGLVVQVFYAGMGIFGASDFDPHIGLGWILHLVPILILGAAALARAGRQRILWAAALAVTVFLVPIVVLLRADAPAIAALHPVLAVISFWLAVTVARKATSLLRETRDEPSRDRALGAG